MSELHTGNAFVFVAGVLLSFFAPPVGVILIVVSILDVLAITLWERWRDG